MKSSNTGKIVKFTLDPSKPLTAEQLAQLAQLKVRPIDLSDIPASLAGAEWTRPGVPITAENKRQITLRLDADVLTYFQHAGKRYQTRINNVLRAYMHAHELKR